MGYTNKLITFAQILKMVISKNTVVTLHYVLREADENGELIEETFGGEPLHYIQGLGMMIPGFEKNLEGKTIGDKYAFTLQPEEGYGPVQEENFVEVPIQNFADESGNVDQELLEIGAPINMTDEDGHTFQGFISEVMEDTLTVDFNHPFAGVALHFSGEVVGLREATAEELDHGHIHGDGGVHH
jgi:FKBP-type peptidyl-prolyl cis-trans isomerase SlyD